MGSVYLKDGTIDKYGADVNRFIDKLSDYQLEAFYNLAIDKQFYIVARLAFGWDRDKVIDNMVNNDKNPYLAKNWESRNDVSLFLHRYTNDDPEYVNTRKDVEHLYMSMMSRSEMIVRLSEMARTDINDLITVKDNDTELIDMKTGEIIKGKNIMVKSFDSMRVGALALISEVSADEKSIRIKFNSPLAAMQQLAKLMGYDKTTLKDIGVTNLPDELTPEQAKLLKRITDESY